MATALLRGIERSRRPAASSPPAAARRDKSTTAAVHLSNQYRQASDKRVNTQTRSRAHRKTRNGVHTQTLAFVSQKGGSGKTTLAVHLASEAALTGDKVLLIDLDPQGSATLWARQRGDRPPDVTAGHLATLKEEIESARMGDYGLVVIDTAPHADQAALQAARVADLVLVPCRPATFDLGAIRLTLDLCQLAKRPALVVLNAAPIRSKVVEEAIGAMSEQGAAASPAVIRQRVAFQHCLIDGRTAGEFEPGGAAADEITTLLADVKTRLHAHNGVA